MANGHALIGLDSSYAHIDHKNENNIYIYKALEGSSFMIEVGQLHVHVYMYIYIYIYND